MRHTYKQIAINSPKIRYFPFIGFLISTLFWLPSIVLYQIIYFVHYTGHELLSETYDFILAYIILVFFNVLGLIISILEFKKAKKIGGCGSLAKAGVVISAIVGSIIVIILIILAFLS